MKHSFSKAGSPIVLHNQHGFIVDRNVSETLREINGVIRHLSRLAECCPEDIQNELADSYDMPCFGDLLCRFEDMRIREFGDCVNWDTIAKAIHEDEAAS